MILYLMFNISFYLFIYFMAWKTACSGTITIKKLVDLF